MNDSTSSLSTHAAESNTSTAIALRPSIEELTRIGTVRCEVCGKQLQNSGMLTIHRRQHGGHASLKAHARQSSQTAAQKKIMNFFCPVSDCVRHSLAKAPYRRMSQLKEHYNSTHAPKRYECSKCSKGFGLLSACARHEKTCGKTYNCYLCGQIFTSTKARIAHVRLRCRFSNDSQFDGEDMLGASSSLEKKIPVEASKIAKEPKPNHAILMTDSNPASQVNAGAQTALLGAEFESVLGLTMLPRQPGLSDSSRSKPPTTSSTSTHTIETQTNEVGTDMNGGYSSTTSMRTDNCVGVGQALDFERELFRSETQPTPVEGSSQTDCSFGTSASFYHPEDSSLLDEVDRSSSSTQTRSDWML